MTAGKLSTTKIEAVTVAALYQSSAASLSTTTSVLLHNACHKANLCKTSGPAYVYFLLYIRPKLIDAMHQMDLRRRLLWALRRAAWRAFQDSVPHIWWRAHGLDRVHLWMRLQELGLFVLLQGMLVRVGRAGTSHSCMFLSRLHI